MTLITNVIGAILIGFIVGITSSRDGISKNMVLFWKTGVCGGFTTFSTFSLESYNLFEHNHCLLGCGYVLLSCLGCILGVMCGIVQSGLRDYRFINYELDMHAF